MADDLNKQLDSVWDDQASPPADYSGGATFTPDQESDLWSDYNPIQAINQKAVDAAKAEVPVAHWGAPENMLNAALLGYGPQIMAGEAAAVEAGRNLLKGGSLANAYHGMTDLYYPQARDVYTSARDAWRQANPGTDIGSRLAGGGLGAVPALAAPELLLGHAGETLARALPALGEAVGPAVRFLAGYGGRGLLSRTASLGLLGARQGAELEAANADGPKDIKAGALAGGATNLLLGPVLGPLLEPFSARVAPEVAQTARELQALGIDLKGSQITSGALGAHATTDQLEAYTRAALQSVNSGATTASVDAINAAKRAAGARLEAVQGRTDINAFQPGPNGRSLIDNLADTHAAASVDPIIANTPGKLATISAMRTQIEDSAINGMGTISGSDYQKLTRTGSPIARALKGPDPELRMIAREFRDHLDTAQEASAPAHDVAELRDARGTYRAAKALEGAAQKAESTGGLFNPRDVASGVRRVYKNVSPPPTLDALARGEKLLPTPTGQGEAKIPRGHGFLSHLGTIGGGAFGGALAGLAEHYAMPFIESTMATQPGAAIAAAGGATLGGLGRWATGRIADSPAYANLLLGSPAWGPVALQSLVNGVHTAPQGAINQLMDYRQGAQ